MRFVCGPIPPSQTFDPKANGWTPLAAGDAEARRFTIAASLMALPLVAAAAWALLASRSGVHDFLAGHPLRLVAVLSAMAALVPLHELVHALAYLKGVRSPHLILGAWLRRGLFYAIYDAPMPRGRVLLMSTMPFLLLSALPALGLPRLELRHELRVVGWFLVLLHTALCTGDFLTWWQLLFRVPRGAWIHNHGWTTYWAVESDRPALPAA